MMLSPTQQRECASAVEEVWALMRRYGLSLEELVEIGGEGLRSKDAKRVEKARRVERTWALMARLGVKHIELENAVSSELVTPAVSMPASTARRRRQRGGFLQPLENTSALPAKGADTKSNEINDLANSALVDEPGTNLAASDQPHGGADAMPGAGSHSIWSEGERPC
jgi:hypothetical protein